MSCCFPQQLSGKLSVAPGQPGWSRQRAGVPRASLQVLLSQDSLSPSLWNERHWESLFPACISEKNELNIFICNQELKKCTKLHFYSEKRQRIWGDWNVSCIPASTYRASILPHSTALLDLLPCSSQLLSAQKILCSTVMFKVLNLRGSAEITLHLQALASLLSYIFLNAFVVGLHIQC